MPSSPSSSSSPPSASPSPIRVGIYIPQVAFEYPDLLARARLCDELGFDSFWLYDHLYGPGMPDAPALEGWTAATALLAQTTRLRVGHMVLSATFRHPALLGKMLTTLDIISGGRVNVGIGSGSYDVEHHEAGIPWRNVAYRSEVLEDTLEILTRMFDGERTTFTGHHVEVRDYPNVPGPIQQPRPPIYVGGVGEKRTLPLVARFADVWNVPTYALDVLDQKAGVLDAECARVGRDTETLRRSLEAVMVLAPDDAALSEARAKSERRFPGPGWGLEAGGYVGTPNAILDRISEHIELGFTEFVFFLHDHGAPGTLELLASQVLPQLKR